MAFENLKYLPKAERKALAKAGVTSSEPNETVYGTILPSPGVIVGVSPYSVASQAQFTPFLGYRITNSGG